MNDMKRLAKGLGIGMIVFLLASCGSDDGGGGGGADAPPSVTPDAPPGGGETITVSADLTADAHWTADNTYVLAGHVFVLGGTLTIDPGTVVKGENGSALVITGAARIVADGTAEAPIVFTSNQPEGERETGDWGGVVLLGRAPINVSGGTSRMEGFPPEEARVVYGGADAAHDCGVLRYARIEFAGFALDADKEINGLTLAACGTGTVVDYVQLHRGKDDGLEIFGGTVNVKHLVVTLPMDDGLDWDFGWVGKLQYAIVQQSPVNGNMGIEADNNNNDNDATPRSNPEIWNLTLIGSDAEPGGASENQRAMHLRRGTAARISNALVMAFADGAVDIDGTASAAQATAGNLVITSSIFFDNANAATWPTEVEDNDGGFDEAAYFAEGEHANRFMNPMLADPMDPLAPSFRPMAGSPAMSGAATPSGAFFDPAGAHVGAIGATDWTAGWTAYPRD